MRAFIGLMSSVVVAFILIAFFVLTNLFEIVRTQLAIQQEWKSDYVLNGRTPSLPMVRYHVQPFKDVNDGKTDHAPDSVD
jgi:hypothetical protein